MRSGTMGATYHTVPLHYLEGDTTGIVTGYRYELLAVCREHHIPRTYVTPYTSRFGYGFVIQGPGDRDVNRVSLWTRDGFRMFQLRAGASTYRALMKLDDYVTLMETIERDYPASSLTATLTATLAQLLQLWAAAKDDGHNVLDLGVVDEIVAARLNPFIRHWLHPEPGEPR
ncbi:hypothetical protein ACWEN6_13890 [Sphaerisporangium sp. NPDC004334]